MGRILLLLATACSFFALELCTGAVYVVNPGGTGDYATIQEAINAAVDGDVIELTDGIFREDGNRDLDFQGKAIVLHSQSANPEACILDCEGSAADPHRAIWFHSQEGQETRIEFITIRNGYALDGGAILGEECYPIIRNCIFEDNYASRFGGAIHAWRFHLYLESCTFVENVSDGWGGAISNEVSSILIESSDFIGNQADTGGACCATGGTFDFSDCTFSSNRGNPGGAICSAGGSGEFNLNRCLFEENYGGVSGGAVFHAGGILTIEDCTFIGNEAPLFNEDFCGGGAISGTYSTPTIRRCTFAGNSAIRGGAIVTTPVLTLISQCTFSSNSADLGGALYIVSTSENSFTMENTIIAFSTQGEAVYCESPTTMSISCCDIYGNVGGDWVGCIAAHAGINGNFSADPLFCGSTPSSTPMLGSQISPYTLHVNSPCMPDHHPGDVECGLIGAHGPGCGPARQDAVAETPGGTRGVVLETTWGRMKSGYR
jgi:hypothetical protein